MGLQDREYMKDRMREQRNNAAPTTAGVRRWWLIAGIVLAIIIVVFTIGRRVPQQKVTPQLHPTLVNVNRASLAELSALPNISDRVGQAIIDGRPYSSADDLIRVHGIGPKTLERIRPYVKMNDEHFQPQLKPAPTRIDTGSTN